jgi:hypothetical protein
VYQVWLKLLQAFQSYAGTYIHKCHYLRNHSTLDIGVLGYIGILYHKEHPPEVWHIPPGTPRIYR